MPMMNLNREINQLSSKHQHYILFWKIKTELQRYIMQHNVVIASYNNDIYIYIYDRHMIFNIHPVKQEYVMTLKYFPHYLSLSEGMIPLAKDQ